MKRKERSKLLIGLFIFSLLLISCKEEEEPSISTINPSDVKSTSAKCGGNIKSDGGSQIIARGICWSTQPQPTIADSISNDGNGIGMYSSTLSNLLPSTQYYIRAYATNNTGTYYGNTIQLLTKKMSYPKAVITGLRVISNNTIECKVEVVKLDGGDKMEEWGVCWDKNKNPTIESNYIKLSQNGVYTNNYIPINKFENNTIYHIRAYAKNDIGGLGYSDEMIFETYDWKIGTVTDIDKNTYKTIKIRTQEWMQENLKVTRFQNGDPIDKITDEVEWNKRSTAAYCWFMNDEVKNKNKYGALYNFYTVLDSRNICPAGWHVPTEVEVITLLDYLGGKDLANKNIRTYSAGGSNESGFSAEKPGRRWEGYWEENAGGFWTTDLIENYGCFFSLSTEHKMLFYLSQKYDGVSIRCVKD